MPSTPAPPPRLAAQVAFLIEADKLKTVVRQSVLTDGSRRENSAEHSWHLSLYAMLLSDSGPPGMDLARAVQMAMIHDLVEIDAGDAIVYDVHANRDKRQREEAAADRIFAILPADQAAMVRGLWEEFEARQTPESKYANALDRAQAILQNCHSDGQAWRKHGITRAQALERNAHIAESSPVLWDYLRQCIDDAAAKGWLK